MNCEQFLQRMQSRIDNRQPVDTDGELTRHALACPSCHRQLRTWNRIEGLFSDRPSPETSSSRLRWYRVAVPSMVAAAALLLCVSVLQHQPKRSSTPTSVAAIPSADGGDGQSLAINEVDPGDWFQDIRSQDWIDQTMPAVRSVQQSVAPLGRSLMRAVTILTTGSGEKPS